MGAMLANHHDPYIQRGYRPFVIHVHVRLVSHMCTFAMVMPMHAQYAVVGYILIYIIIMQDYVYNWDGKWSCLLMPSMHVAPELSYFETMPTLLF